MRTKVLARVAALAWFAFVAAYAGSVVALLVGIAQGDHPVALLVRGAFILLLGIPTARHLRDAPEMGRMVVHGA